MARACAFGSTRRRRRFRFSWRWASGKTARKCCWRSRTWVERVRRPGGRSSTIWSSVGKRGLKTPELVIVDGAPGLEKALAALWSNITVQRCTVHKHRNLLAHAPERLHEEISADYKDM